MRSRQGLTEGPAGPGAARLVLGLVVTGTVALWLARMIDVADLARLWSERRAGPLAAALASYATVYGFRGVRYRAVGVRLDARRLLAIAALHGFFNRVLPSKTGELAYGLMVRRAGGASFASGMIGLVQIRILDLFTVGVFAAIALASTSGERRSEALPLVATALVATALAYAALGPALRLAGAVAARLLPGDGWGARAAERLRMVAEEVARTPGTSRLVLLGASLGAWLFSYVTYWLVLRGVSVELPLATVVVGASVSNLASGLPVTAIGTFGALEAGWAAGFVWAGVDPAVAAATALATSAITLVYAALFAAAGFAVLPRSP